MEALNRSMGWDFLVPLAKYQVLNMTDLIHTIFAHKVISEKMRLSLVCSQKGW